MKYALFAVLTACAAAPATTTACFYDCPPTTDDACIYDCAPAATPKAKPRTGKLGKLGAAGEKIQVLREAAAQLEKAVAALDAGNKRLAEQLFSTAEILAPDELASLGPMFREGAPPRVTTPPIAVDATPPQPIAVGNTEAEDEKDNVEVPKIEGGSLSGTVRAGSANGFGLVALEPIGRPWRPRTPKQHVIEQRGREFRPHVLAVAVGSTIAFPNFDPLYHNVFSISSTAPFDLGLFPTGQARQYTFNKEGIVRLGCNIHANMSGYILVVSAPSYAVTDERGQFSFRWLLPGKYRLRAWSERSKAMIEQIITVKVGKNVVDVGVAADAPSGPSPDKFGAPRTL